MRRLLKSCAIPPARQPERLEALRLPELLLERFSLADVDDEALLRDGLAGGVSHERHVVEHPDDLAVGPDHPVLALHEILDEAARVQLRVDLAIVRVDELRREARLREPALHRIAEERLRLPALEERWDREVFQAPQVRDERQPVDDAAMPLLGFGQARGALTTAPPRARRAAAR